MTTDKTIRPLREDDLDDLIAIREVAFLDRRSRVDPDVRQTHLDTLDNKYGLFVDGALTASASWYPLEANLYGRPTEIYGLASVVSDPAKRRRGYVGDLMVHGLELMRERGAAWCLEYPFDTRFYRKYGWHTIANGQFVHVPPERLSEFDTDPGARRVVEVDEDALSRVADIYAAWAERFNFTLRKRADVLGGWTRILEGEPWHDDPRYLYLMDDAYALFRMANNGERELVHVVDFAYSSPAGRRRLLSFLANFRGQSDIIRLQLPTGDPLLLEWSNFVERHPHPLHARVVDVRRALAELPAEEKLDVVIEVRDDVCDWNNGRFRVAWFDGELDVTSTDAPAAIHVDIRDLAQLLSGSVAPADALDCGLVEGDASSLDLLLAHVERRSHMPLSDYF